MIKEKMLIPKPLEEHFSYISFDGVGKIPANSRARKLYPAWITTQY
jgi:hypothetical protein